MSQSPQRRRVSPAVFRRRRIAAALLVVAIVAIMVLLLWRPWASSGTPAADGSPSASPSQAPSPTPTPTPEKTSTPSPSSTPDGGKPVACDPGSVRVEADTDKDAYGDGVEPKLSLSVTNTGDVACTLNVGTSQQVFTITSGSETYWRSTDCQTEPSDAIVTLEPGVTLPSSTPLEWDRTRSSVDTCDAERDPVPAGGATYHLVTAIGGITSEDSASFALD